MPHKNTTISGNVDETKCRIYQRESAEIFGISLWIRDNVRVFRFADVHQSNSIEAILGIIRLSILAMDGGTQPTKNGERM